MFDLKAKACRYYDTLKVPAQGNLQAAVKVLGIVNHHIEGMPAVVPYRSNLAMQRPGSLQCGLLVMH